MTSDKPRYRHAKAGQSAEIKSQGVNRRRTLTPGQTSTPVYSQVAYTLNLAGKVIVDKAPDGAQSEPRGRGDDLLLAGGGLAGGVDGAGEGLIMAAPESG